jgi:hypothetical protein
MYKILTASSDNYITNKYISGFRVTDSNVGSAGTLDLYKLYNETSSSDDSLVELSRILLKFDMSEVEKINNTKCPIDHPSFNATLKMFDVYGGQTTPENFSVRVYPLSQSFDEGKGRDVVRYRDLGSSNFITASISSGEILKWNTEGANASGNLNDENIDIIETGTLEGSVGNENLYVDKAFKTGKEDLEIDVTKIISGTVAGLIPDCGLRVSFTPSIESNQETYFVKRFASRNATDPTLRPQLVIKYDDSIHDYHKGMSYNNSGSLFINNFVNGKYSYLKSGSTDFPGTLEDVSGENCMLVKIMTGSYEKYVSASSYKLGSIEYPGIYSASFLIGSFESGISANTKPGNSITFTTVWTDAGQKTLYHSGSFTITNDNVTSFSNTTNRLVVSVTNLKKSYYRNSVARFRVFVDNVDKVIPYVKIPREKSSEVYYNMRYAVVDVDTGKYLIPFEKNDRSTILSVDSDGMYFDLDMMSLPPKRIYKLVFLLEDRNEERIFTNTASVFRVV